MRRFLNACLFLCLAALPRVASAQVTPAAGYTPPDDTPSITVGATIFANYVFTSTPDGTDADGNLYSPNAFESSRAYININGKINHAITFRITPDVTRNANVGNSAVFRLKYAFAQYSLDDWSGQWSQTWVRLGIQQTPTVDYQEGIYRYRFQGTVFAERTGKLTSSDAGVSFHSNLPNNYGDVHVGLYNGEGYATTEVNNQKAFQARFTVRPMATGALVARGLRFSIFYDKDAYIQGDEKKRAQFQTTFEHPHLNMGFEYLDAKDQTTKAATDVNGRGYSIWATPAFKQKGNGPELLLRYDSFVPDHTSFDTRKQNTTIVGFAYWFPHTGGPTAALLLDFEQLKFAGYPGTPANATQQRIGVHGLINF
jgi:hypothetical protein